MNNFLLFTLSDIIQIILGLIGFFIAIFEIRKTKSAIDAYKEATTNTINSISTISDIEDIAKLASELREIASYIRGNRYEAALFHSQSIKVKLCELRGRNHNNENFQTDIQTMLTYLTRLDQNLETEIVSRTFSINIPNVNSKLSQFSLILTERGEVLKYSERVKNDSGSI
jgi:hypothetical protein